MQATTENYKEIISKYSYLIGKSLNPKHLPLLYLTAADWSTHGPTQVTWLKNKHSLNPNDLIVLTAEELKHKIEEIENIEWPKQFLEIQGFFRDENNGRVFFYPLEYIIAQNPGTI